MESNEQQPKPIPSGLIPFEKGKSGNPGGRPKSSLLANACRDKLDEIDPKTGLTGAKTLADALYREACRGNVKAFREFREICEGKINARLFTRVTELTETSGAENVRRRLYEKLVGFGTTTVIEDGSTIHETERFGQTENGN